jgi:glucans biosynthesis protein
VRPGNELLYGYRIYWGTPAAAAPPVGYTLATRTGLGGVVGRKRDYFSARFAVDFIGGALADLRAGAAVEPVISVSDGTVEHASARPLADGPFKGRGFRAIFDVKPRDDSSEPIDIRMYLRSPDQPLTETWMYQWLVPPPAVRKEMLALAGSGTS